MKSAAAVPTAPGAPLVAQVSTPALFAQRYPNLGSVGSLRWQIFNADTNGLEASGALLRVGRKILIDEQAYFAWLRSGAASGGQRAAA